ncbi:MAG: hypothetical protein WBQ50_09770 [Nocardioides sp.]
MFDNTTMTISQNAGLAMSMTTRERVASVRALPVISGVVCLPAAGAVMGLWGTAVCGYTHDADVAVVKGAFPGTSAWSPPI